MPKGIPKWMHTSLHALVPLVLAVTFVFEHPGEPELVGFIAERSPKDCTTWSTIADLPATARSFTDSTTLAAGKYCYRVLAYTTSDSVPIYSEPSNVVVVPFTNRAGNLKLQAVQQTR